MHGLAEQMMGGFDAGKEDSVVLHMYEYGVRRQSSITDLLHGTEYRIPC